MADCSASKHIGGNRTSLDQNLCLTPIFIHLTFIPPTRSAKALSRRTRLQARCQLCVAGSRVMCSPPSSLPKRDAFAPGGAARPLYQCHRDVRRMNDCCCDRAKEQASHVPKAPRAHHDLVRMSLVSDTNDGVANWAKLRPYLERNARYLASLDRVPKRFEGPTTGNFTFIRSLDTDVRQPKCLPVLHIHQHDFRAGSSLRQPQRMGDGPIRRNRPVHWYKKFHRYLPSPLDPVGGVRGDSLDLAGLVQVIVCWRNADLKHFRLTGRPPCDKRRGPRFDAGSDPVVVPPALGCFPSHTRVSQ